MSTDVNCAHHEAMYRAYDLYTVDNRGGHMYYCPVCYKWLVCNIDEASVKAHGMCTDCKQA